MNKVSRDIKELAGNDPKGVKKMKKLSKKQLDVLKYE